MGSVIKETLIYCVYLKLQTERFNLSTVNDLNSSVNPEAVCPTRSIIVGKHGFPCDV